MNLLPLQIVLGFQVAAAVVIFIQLMKGDGSERSVPAEKPLRGTASRPHEGTYENDER